MVPVGADQKQHLELTRDVATRFNNIYPNVFTVPEPFIPKTGARVMSLQDPTQKMSKSDPNINAWVAMLDKPDDIMRKFKRAVTDSDACVKYAPGKDGINNLMEIYSAVTGMNYDAIEKEFEGKGYGDFKMAVGEAVVDALKPVQERFDDLMKNRDYLESIWRDSAKKAESIAYKTLGKAMKKIGFIY